ncbi:hypothetical protein MNU23_25145 [Pseudomonas aeruginosa]|uniref:hypothetical protein n=1 Tax=Pseudomonas aeruginosa TaxID=287 RepID=UPI0021A6B4A9|nr:hypothetical protein [Pseudomonas aeruginosa]MCT2414965.1 hypothetical protein [Pseudomonas aeruginosa]
MPRQLAGLLYVLFGLAGAPALACPFRATDAETPAASAGAAQVLALGGAGRLQLDLQRAPATLLHSGDLLIARYAEGHYLAHRLLEGNEMGADEGERLDLPRQVRLLFGALPLDGLPNAERERLEAQRQALGLCDRRASASRYRLAGTEVYRLRGSQAGKPYHALYLLDGPQVHYLDSSGSDAFVEQLLASLRRR